jgi:hypothetical protein
MSAQKTILATVVVFGLSVSAANAQVAYQPNIGTFNDGVVLSATPAVSADRRYVRIGINPQFTSLIGFNNYSVPAAVGSGPGGPGALGGAVGLGVPAGMYGLLDDTSAMGGATPRATGTPLNTSGAIARARRARAAAKAVEKRPTPLEFTIDGLSSAKPRKASIQP